METAPIPVNHRANHNHVYVLELTTFNPLITNDAYMRQIIACAEVPMTHICVKDEGTHFHGIFGCCERATALSSSQPIQ